MEVITNINTQVYLDISILVKETDKSLHKMEKEIDTTKQTLIVAYLWPDSSYLKGNENFDEKKGEMNRNLHT